MAVEMNREWVAAEECLKYLMLPHKIIDSVITPQGRVFMVYDDKHFRCLLMTFQFDDKGGALLKSVVHLVEEKR